MKRSILLVGDDLRATKQVARDLAAVSGWDVIATGNASEALVILGRTPCAAVVADLRLAGASGVLLLNEVMRRQSSIHRIVVTDFKDKQGLLKCIGTAHQFLARPCDAARLRAALEQAFAYDLWLPDEPVQRLISFMTRLPSPPDLFFKVIKELQSEHTSLESVGAIVAQDVALTAKLLQIANSAAFGLGQPVSNPTEAIMHLGLDSTKSVILLAHCFSYFDAVKPRDFSAEELWQHSLRVGTLAHAIAAAENASPTMLEEARTAGMLHDLGKVAIVANMPAEFAKAMALSRANCLSAPDAETRIFGTTHAEIGGALLASWGLSPNIVEALALHHSPARLLNRTFCPLTAVHVANIMDHALISGSEPHFDLAYLKDLEVTDRVPAWRELCGEQLSELGVQLVAA